METRAFAIVLGGASLCIVALDSILSHVEGYPLGICAFPQLDHLHRNHPFLCVPRFFVVLGGLSEVVLVVTRLARVLIQGWGDLGR